MAYIPEYASSARPFRQYSYSQQLLMREQERSNYTIDKVTLFGLRCPELLFVVYITLYLAWFTFHPVRVTVTNVDAVMARYVDIDDIQSGYWYDGTNRVVRIRKGAIPAFYEYTVDVLRGLHGPYHPQLPKYYYSLVRHLYVYPEEYPHLVDFDDPIPCVVVPSLTLPRATASWLIHLALYYGRYTTEIELFATPSLLEVYRKCGLYDTTNGEQSLYRLLSLWCDRELRAMPGSHRTFMRNLSYAKEVLSNFFGDGGILYFDSPIVSLRQIAISHSVEVWDYIYKNRVRFVAAIPQFQLGGLPSASDLLTATLEAPLSWRPTIVGISGQSAASIMEQTFVLEACVTAIDRVLNATKTFVPYPLLVGYPGCGKTSCAILAGAYGRSKGLEITCTSLSSERGMLLGGCHLHMLFGIGVNRNTGFSTSSEMVYSALQKLRMNPIKMAFLMSIDILIVDECGLIDQCLFTTMSEILCELRKTRVPFGGSLLVLTGDPCQLNQISGESLWISPYVHTLFDMYGLAEPVRCRGDPILQRCIGILRDVYFPVDRDDIDYVIHSLTTKCTLVDSVDAVRRQSGYTTFEIYSKRRSERQALQAFTKYLNDRQSMGETIYASIADDEYNEGGLHNVWRAASSLLVQKLERYSPEPRELKVAIGVVLRFTRNGVSSDGTTYYSQGQLALCNQLPSDTGGSSLGVCIAPAGVRNITDVDVLNPPVGWVKTRINRDFGYEISVGSITMRRRQYPVTNHVSCTIHKAVGLTCPAIITRIASPASDAQYALWERQQLLVLISRVPALSCITFINSRDEIRETVEYLLNKRCKDIALITHIVSAVAKTHNSTNQDRVVVQRLGSLPIRVYDLSVHNGGCVYCLLSTNSPDHTYVGTTIDLQQRFDAHNRGLKGSKYTAVNSLKPWRVAAIIVGFPYNADNLSYNISARMEVETSWHHLMRTTDSLFVVLSKGKSLLRVFRNKYPNLKFIDYCSIVDTNV